MNQKDLDQLNIDYKTASAEEVLKFAVKKYGKVNLSLEFRA